jgi:FtsH-binding integral membrane protein
LPLKLEILFSREEKKMGSMALNLLALTLVAVICATASFLAGAVGFSEDIVWILTAAGILIAFVFGLIDRRSSNMGPLLRSYRRGD